MSKRIIISLVSVLSLIAAIVIAGAPSPKVPTDKDPAAYKGLSAEGIKRLRAGEIIILKDIKESENPSGMIEAALMLKQNIDKVWEMVVTNVTDQCKYLPYLEECTMFKQDGNHYIVGFKLSLMNVDVDYRVDHIAEKNKYYFHWDLDPTYDNKMKTLKGFWRFFKVNERITLARYGTWFEIGVGVPKFVQSFLIKRDLPQSLNNVQTYINSGGKWRKEGYKGD